MTITAPLCQEHGHPLIERAVEESERHPAAIAVIGALGAAWLTQHSITHVRAADRAAEAHGRLHEDRMAAYHEFTSAFLEYSRSHNT